MLSHAPNVAHVEGGAGTLVLPAYSPYDRQMLREHVETLAARVPTLTLGVHGVRWTVSRDLLADSRCTTCMQFLGRLSCSRGGEAVASCIECAMHPENDACEEWESV
jgi:hypothetical protein